MKFHFPRRSPKRQPSGEIEKIAYTSHPLAPGALLGEYKIEDLLSQTRSGYTYTANGGTVLLQEYFPRDIAIRDLDGTSVLLHDEVANPCYEHGLSQFLLLARILSQIDHPGRVVHYQEQHDTAWYAVHFEPRASLGNLLSIGKRLPEDALQTILGSALIFIDAAHQHGIFHLELGPEQLILSAEEELVVCGFNVARLLGLDRGEKEAAYYFAPEHLHTAGRLGAWSDFYGLGAMLYQGLNSRIPPTAARRVAAVEARRPDPLVPAANLGKGYYSEEFLELIDWLLEISTGDRPKSVEDLLGKMDPDGPVARQTQASASISFGPAYAGQNTGLSPLESNTNTFIDDDVKETDYASSLDISSSKSDPTPAGAARLAVAALQSGSEEASSPDEVANVLEQAAKMLEPADLKHRWANHFSEESENNSPPATDDYQLTSPIGITPDESEGSRASLRPRAFSSQTKEPTYHPSQFDYGARPADIVEATTRTGGTLFRSYQAHNPLLWLCLLGAITVAGIWLWIQNQPAQITDPVRIEILGFGDGSAIDQSSRALTFTDLGTTADANFKNSVTSNHSSVNSLLADAKRYVGEEVWFGNTADNAYAAYQQALLLEPANTAARDGINELIKLSLVQISSQLDHMQLDSARALMAILRQRELAMQQLPRFEKRLRSIENEIHQEDLARALVADQLRKEEGIRREKINNLLNRASNAFENGNLIQPHGENALTLYRAALDLDRNNQRARNGINSIGDHFVQQARMALATADLIRAEQNLQRAATVRKGDPTILRLQRQLVQRRDLLKRERKIQAELAAKRMEAKRLALEQARINLKSGIEAYYRGNYFEAYSFLYPLAEVGIARAQVRVAAMLLQGRGVSANKAYARQWFLKALSPVQLAAARGHAWAQSDYGDYFADGIAIPQDFRQAVIWYRRSADQDYSPAQANLGLMHMHGSGVPPDWNEAIEWFRMAAAQGNYAAKENLRLLEVQPSSTGS